MNHSPPPPQKKKRNSETKAPELAFAIVSWIRRIHRCVHTELVATTERNPLQPSFSRYLLKLWFLDQKTLIGTWETNVCFLQGSQKRNVFLTETEQVFVMFQVYLRCKLQRFALSWPILVTKSRDVSGNLDHQPAFFLK